MPKLPSVKSKLLLKILLKNGFEIRAQEGSHCNLKHPDGRRVTIPVHNQDIRTGTLHNIIDQLRISKDDFIDLLKK